MSESRETTLKDSAVELSPSTKRDSFHWPKYSLIVGTITTRAVKASDSDGSQASADVASSLAYLSNASAAARSNAASGSTSPKLLRAVAVEIGGVLCGSSSGRVPQRAPSVRL